METIIELLRVSHRAVERVMTCTLRGSNDRSENSLPATNREYQFSYLWETFLFDGIFCFCTNYQIDVCWIVAVDPVNLCYDSNQLSLNPTILNLACKSCVASKAVVLRVREYGNNYCSFFRYFLFILFLLSH